MRACAAALLTTIAMAGMAAAPPALAADLRGRYEVVWSGMRVGVFEITVAANPAGYRIAYVARTVGLLDALFPFSSEGTSKGRRVGDALVPVSYRASSTRRAERSDWAVRFDAAGRAVEVMTPAADAGERDPVPEDLQRGPDPAALALAALAAVAPGARHSGTSFDGRRVVRFDLSCPAGETEPGLLVCSVAGEQIAGWHRRWSDGDRGSAGEREPTRVWLRAGLVGDGYWPERIEAETRFGSVIAKLARDPAEEAS